MGEKPPFCDRPLSAALDKRRVRRTNRAQFGLTALDARSKHGGYVDDGDVIAFSGPVPYSFGYGAPIV